MTSPGHATTALRILQLLYAAFWIGILFTSPPPQAVPAAEHFWKAIEETGFLQPLLGACYVAGGALLLFQRTAPLGLAILSPPLTIIIFFNVFLVQKADIWVLLVAIQAVLLWHFREAFVPLWSYRPRGQ